MIVKCLIRDSLIVDHCKSCIVYDKNCSLFPLLSISCEVAEEVEHVFLSANADLRDKDLVKGSQRKDNLAFGESKICVSLLGLVMYFFNHIHS